MHRLAEPSTWAGIGIMFQVLKGFMPAHTQMYADALSAAAGALAASLSEKHPVGQ